jgi:hypothetical protein
MALLKLDHVAQHFFLDAHISLDVVDDNSMFRSVERARYHGRQALHTVGNLIDHPGLRDHLVRIHLNQPSLIRLSGVRTAKAVDFIEKVVNGEENLLPLLNLFALGQDRSILSSVYSIFDPTKVVD